MLKPLGYVTFNPETNMQDDMPQKGKQYMIGPGGGNLPLLLSLSLSLLFHSPLYLPFSPPLIPQVILVLSG